MILQSTCNRPVFSFRETDQMENLCFTVFFFRGVIAESKDVIKAAADGLGKNGFINYYGLQVYSCHALMFQNLFSFYF
jgi:hypothetical protein